MPLDFFPQVAISGARMSAATIIICILTEGRAPPCPLAATSLHGSHFCDVPGIRVMFLYFYSGFKRAKVRF